MVDETTFPTAAAFVRGLPSGFDSYPACLVKGSVMRELVLTQAFAEIALSVPDPLKVYVEQPPIATAWVSEVHFHVMIHAVADRFAKKGQPHAAFIEWVDKQNRLLFAHPLYRVIFFVMSPERLFKAADKRWSALRRGTSLEILSTGARSAEFKVTHPPRLYTPLMAEVRASSFRIAAECAGAKNPTVTLAPCPPGETRFVARWS